MKIFISQPMNGKTDEEIWRERVIAIETAKIEYGEDTEIINSFFDDENPISLLTENFNGLGHLGMSLILLSKADKAMFLPGWQDARGCVIEHSCCEKYGIEIALD